MFIETKANVDILLWVKQEKTKAIRKKNMKRFEYKTM